MTIAADFRQLVDAALRRASERPPLNMKQARAQRKRVRKLGRIAAHNLAAAYRPEGVP